MTDANTRTAANVLLVSAAMAAAYVIITTPPLRRLAGRAARVWVGASVPAALLGVVHAAWVESGRTT